MTEPETTQPVAEKDTTSVTLTTETLPPEPEPEAETPPEPWTPERVSEWNAYYDIYVLLAGAPLNVHRLLQLHDGLSTLASSQDRSS